MLSQLNKTHPDRAHIPARSRTKGTIAAFVALGALGFASFAATGVAGAAVQSFRVSPGSGPIGTVVNVSGTACSPGASVSSAQDYVQVASTTLPISTRVRVAADGSWHGSFTVPNNSLPLPGLIEAACFTDGVPSTETIYTPQSFTVTNASATPGAGTTPGNSGGGNPGGGVTTQPGNGSGNGAGNGAGNGSGAGSGNNGSGTNGSGSGSGFGPGGSGSSGAGGSNAADVAKLTRVASANAAAKAHRAAALSASGHNRFPWIPWLLLLLLAAIAAVGAFFLGRRRRDPEVVNATTPNVS